MKHIDCPTLWSVLDEDQSLLEDLATLFAQSLSDSLARLRIGLREHDSEVVCDVTHNLKSRLRYFAAAELYELTVELETAGSRRQFDGCDATLSRLIQGIDELLVELRELTDLSLEVASFDS